MVVVARGDSAVLALEEIERLRLAVWSPIVGDDLARRRFSIDGLDRESWHVGVRREGILVACGRLSFHEGPAHLPDTESFASLSTGFAYPCCFMNRLVVDTRSRGDGLAATVVAGRIDLARQLGAGEVWVEAHSNRTAQLRQYGFDPVCRSGDTAIAGDWWLFRRQFEHTRARSDTQ